MEVNPPGNGEPSFRKRLHRVDEPGSARELTFSCYARHPFLSKDRTRIWLLEAMSAARSKWGVEFWAYVIMPEHVHLLVVPPSERIDGVISGFLKDVKEPVARQAIAFLEEQQSAWLDRITVQEGKRTRRRFWQPGGGYDRNIDNPATLRHVIDYFHANPMRRKLVQKAIDWEWSSARWFAGLKPVRLEMDASVWDELNRA